MSSPRNAQLIRWGEGGAIALLLSLGTSVPFALLLLRKWRGPWYLGPCVCVVAFVVARLIDLRWRRGTQDQPQSIPGHVVEAVRERFHTSLTGDDGGKVTGPSAKTSRDAVTRN